MAFDPKTGGWVLAHPGCELVNDRRATRVQNAAVRGEEHPVTDISAQAVLRRTAGELCARKSRACDLRTVLSVGNQNAAGLLKRRGVLLTCHAKLRLLAELSLLRECLLLEIWSSLRGHRFFDDEILLNSADFRVTSGEDQRRKNSECGPFQHLYFKLQKVSSLQSWPLGISKTTESI